MKSFSRYDHAAVEVMISHPSTCAPPPFWNLGAHYIGRPRTFPTHYDALQKFHILMQAQNTTKKRTTRYSHRVPQCQTNSHNASLKPFLRSFAKPISTRPQQNPTPSHPHTKSKHKRNPQRNKTAPHTTRRALRRLRRSRLPRLARNLVVRELFLHIGNKLPDHIACGMVFADDVPSAL